MRHVARPPLRGQCSADPHVDKRAVEGVRADAVFRVDDQQDASFTRDGVTFVDGRQPSSTSSEVETESAREPGVAPAIIPSG
jgi:hypothetical protein